MFKKHQPENKENKDLLQVSTTAITDAAAVTIL